MIASGNAVFDGARFNGWFVGDLARWAEEGGLSPERMARLRDTRALEVKCGAHPAGEPRPGGWASGTPTITLSILVSGEFRLAFRTAGSAEERDVIFRAPGDYAIWDSSTEHTWSAIQDSVVLTIRWPEASAEHGAP